MGRKPHYFLAIGLPDETKRELYLNKEKIKYHFPFKSWVHEQDYHITLAFLGSIEDPQQLLALTEKVSIIAEQYNRFMLELTSFGTFGQDEHPRILWYGIHNNETLFLLQKDIYKACIELGFLLDTRPYSPHITIGRKWRGEKIFNIKTLNNASWLLTNHKVFKVNQLSLYQTDIESIPKYKPIKFFSLENNRK
ncbi:RNA 2',3'-cyclic phosphodiesterase [Cytobacillus sp. IB215665]|uniref:RNA 2',3'-cyclic phosphodiesterase n=1 Tax=Cytobacillus sp. IB215665 TaxID=3097357 RepID=UPI002A0E4C00|nr:RNA 2',3'-cyclic phosphodiesterase [Cytobacillus sp. IB215665]MDX8367473.1 RNA 2',3'-cyclic phosphodiesterase [Cytobacillus sp. IB215665]